MTYSRCLQCHHTRVRKGLPFIMQFRRNTPMYKYLFVRQDWLIFFYCKQGYYSSSQWFRENILFPIFMTCTHSCQCPVENRSHIGFERMFQVFPNFILIFKIFCSALERIWTSKQWHKAGFAPGISFLFIFACCFWRKCRKWIRWYQQCCYYFGKGRFESFPILQICIKVFGFLVVRIMVVELYHSGMLENTFMSILDRFGLTTKI